MLKRIFVGLLLVAATVATVDAQDGKVGGKRLYPKSGNPDGTLNCAPYCDYLGPCC